MQGETGPLGHVGEGAGRRCQPAHRRSGARAAGLWSALPSSLLAGPTLSVASSVLCSLRCSLHRVLSPFGLCFKVTHWKGFSPSLISELWADDVGALSPCLCALTWLWVICCNLLPQDGVSHCELVTTTATACHYLKLV